MSTEFTGAPLVMGSVRGARVFDVDALGRLTGVSYRQVWTPGENDAECKIPVVSKAESEEMNGRYYGREISISRGYYTYGPPAHRVKGTPHDLASCNCGFYAYYDGGANDYEASGKVHGVVDAWGETTIGTRGFRASKAKILALAVPAPDNRLVMKIRRSHKVARVAYVVGILFGLLGTISGAIHSRNWVVVMSFVGLMLNVVGLVWNLINEPPKLPADESASLRKRIAARYPDVPMFESVADLLAAFPPDRGAEPTPETDPEFWTRSI